MTRQSVPWRALVALCPLLLGPVLLVALPARAAVVTQSLELAETGIDDSPFNITGADFNAKLGTLEKVTATISGTYQTNILLESPVTGSVVPSTLRYFFDFFGAGNTFTGSLGSLPLTNIGPALVSAFRPLKLSFTVPDLTTFEAGVPGPDVLGEFDFFSSVKQPLGTPSDASTFFGTLTLDYVYTPAADVPEPGALALCATGLPMLLLTLRSRRRRGR